MPKSTFWASTNVDRPTKIGIAASTKCILERLKIKEVPSKARPFRAILEYIACPGMA